MKFTLIPFTPEPALPELHGVLHLGTHGLQVRYDLTGDLEGLRWPEPEPDAGRETGLWNSTCLELFISSTGEKSYREINLSPAGGWNCFSFTDCRKGMQECRDVEVLELHQWRDQDHVTLEAGMKAGGWPDPPWRVGVSAVIHLRGENHYYALEHGNRPDFHDRRYHVPYRDTCLPVGPSAGEAG